MNGTVSRLVSVVAVLAAVTCGLSAAGCSQRGAGTKEVPDKDSGIIRVATFNVGGLPESPGADDASRLEVLATAITLADADVLALQDVESRAAVERFRDEYLSDLGYLHVASLDVGHPKGAENAVLSRFPITDSKVWPRLVLEGEHPRTVHGEPNQFAGQPIRFRCSPIMVTVRVEGSGLPMTDLTLFNLDHKGGDKYRYWREAEAAAIARLAEEAGAAGRVVVLGSFHAERGSRAVDTYLERGLSDVFKGHGEAAKVVTEASGDRTDLILVNEPLQDEVDKRGSFVIGDEAASELAALEHFPVVVAVRLGG